MAGVQRPSKQQNNTHQNQNNIKITDHVCRVHRRCSPHRLPGPRKLQEIHPRGPHLGITVPPHPPDQDRDQQYTCDPAGSTYEQTICEPMAWGSRGREHGTAQHKPEQGLSCEEHMDGYGKGAEQDQTRTTPEQPICPALFPLKSAFLPFNVPSMQRIQYPPPHLPKPIQSTLQLATPWLTGHVQQINSSR